jgi:hypothetical protein
MANQPESQDDQQMNIKEARDKYVREQTREMLFTMKDEQLPKGVAFSQLMMAVPLLGFTSFLCLLAPMAANPAFVDPTQFAYLARSSLRLLALNISFMGGIHYGLGAALYETADTPEELLRVKYQIAYSVVPAVMCMGSTGFLLFASPLTVPHVIFGFTSLMLT